MKKVIVIILSVLCLACCGKRGKLDFPPGTTYPRQYPAPRQPKYGQMKQVTPPAVKEQPESGVEINVLTKTEE